MNYFKYYKTHRTICRIGKIVKSTGTVVTSVTGTAVDVSNHQREISENEAVTEQNKLSAAIARAQREQYERKEVSRERILGIFGKKERAYSSN